MGATNTSFLLCPLQNIKRCAIINSLVNNMKGCKDDVMLFKMLIFNLRSYSDF